MIRRVSLFMAFFYFLSGVVFVHAAERNFWEERKLALRPLDVSPHPLSFVPAPSSFAPRVSGRGTLSRFGTIRSNSNLESRGRKSHTPPAGRTPSFIFHIQDIHQNPEAQKNIASVLQELIRRNRIDVLALEGAFGSIDLTPFRTYPHPDVVHRVADHLFARNRLSGALYASLTNSGPAFAVEGIDDPRLYTENVEAYRESSKRQARIMNQIQSWKLEIRNKKETTFDRSLLDFDEKIESYRSGYLFFGDYVGLFSKVELGDNGRAFLEALKLERSLDLKKVESERSRFLARLARRLDDGQTKNFLQTLSAYHDGRLSHADFYRFLGDLSRAIGLPASAFPHFNRYLRYQLTADRIDGDGLFAELRRAERKRYESLTRTRTERDVLRESRRLYLTEKLVRFALTKDEWEESKSIAPSSLRGEEFDASELASFERFYEKAEARDRAMADNLRGVIKKHHAKNVVLVTGGFHAGGIKSNFERRRSNLGQGISFLLFVPRISKMNDSSSLETEVRTGGSYLSIFTQEKTPLEELFQGNKLFVAAPQWPRALRNETGLHIAAQGVLSKEATMSETKTWLDATRSYFSWIRIRLSRWPDEALNFIGAYRLDGHDRPFSLRYKNWEITLLPPATALLGGWLASWRWGLVILTVFYMFEKARLGSTSARLRLAGAAGGSNIGNLLDRLTDKKLEETSLSRFYGRLAIEIAGLAILFRTNPWTSLTVGIFISLHQVLRLILLLKQKIDRTAYWKESINDVIVIFLYAVFFNAQPLLPILYHLLSDSLFLQGSLNRLSPKPDLNRIRSELDALSTAYLLATGVAFFWEAVMKPSPFVLPFSSPFWNALVVLALGFFILMGVLRIFKKGIKNSRIRRIKSAMREAFRNPADRLAAEILQDPFYQKWGRWLDWRFIGVRRLTTRVEEEIQKMRWTYYSPFRLLDRYLTSRLDPRTDDGVRFQAGVLTDMMRGRIRKNRFPPIAALLKGRVELELDVPALPFQIIHPPTGIHFALTPEKEDVVLKELTHIMVFDKTANLQRRQWGENGTEHIPYGYFVDSRMVAGLAIKVDPPGQNADRFTVHLRGNVPSGDYVVKGYGLSTAETEKTVELRPTDYRILPPNQGDTIRKALRFRAPETVARSKDHYIVVYDDLLFDSGRIVREEANLGRFAVVELNGVYRPVAKSAFPLDPTLVRQSRLIKAGEALPRLNPGMDVFIDGSDEETSYPLTPEPDLLPLISGEDVIVATVEEGEANRVSFLYEGPIHLDVRGAGRVESRTLLWDREFYLKRGYTGVPIFDDSEEEHLEQDDPSLADVVLKFDPDHQKITVENNGPGDIQLRFNPSNYEGLAKAVRPSAVNQKVTVPFFAPVVAVAGGPASTHLAIPALDVVPISIWVAMAILLAALLVVVRSITIGRKNGTKEYDETIKYPINWRDELIQFFVGEMGYEEFKVREAVRSLDSEWIRARKSLKDIEDFLGRMTSPVSLADVASMGLKLYKMEEAHRIFRDFTEIPLSRQAFPGRWEELTDTKTPGVALDQALKDFASDMNPLLEEIKNEQLILPGKTEEIFNAFNRLYTDLGLEPPDVKREENEHETSLAARISRLIGLIRFESRNMESGGRYLATNVRSIGRLMLRDVAERKLLENGRILVLQDNRVQILHVERYAVLPPVRDPVLIVELRDDAFDKGRWGARGGLMGTHLILKLYRHRETTIGRLTDPWIQKRIQDRPEARGIGERIMALPSEEKLHLFQQYNSARDWVRLWEARMVASVTLMSEPDELPTFRHVDAIFGDRDEDPFYNDVKRELLKQFRDEATSSLEIIDIAMEAHSDLVLFLNAPSKEFQGFTLLQLLFHIYKESNEDRDRIRERAARLTFNSIAHQFGLRVDPSYSNDETIRALLKKGPEWLWQKTQKWKYSLLRRLFPFGVFLFLIATGIYFLSIATKGLGFGIWAVGAVVLAGVVGSSEGSDSYPPDSTDNLSSNHTPVTPNPSAVGGPATSLPERLADPKEENLWDRIARRILWTSLKMVQTARKGHQAASASTLHIDMAIDYFAKRGWDHVAKKPHAAPNIHAANYLLGLIPEEWLHRHRETAVVNPEEQTRETVKTTPYIRTLMDRLVDRLPEEAREGLGKVGFHAYPSHHDPDGTTIPTGSVGLGGSTTIALGLVQKWLKSNGYAVPGSHFFAVVGDGEADEGNYLEAVPEAARNKLGSVTHVIDYNRKSLDGTRSRFDYQNLKSRFFGWDMIELKWGRRLLDAMSAAGGDILADVMEALTPEDYETFLQLDGGILRAALLERANELEKMSSSLPAFQALLSHFDDPSLGDLIRDLGGHDLVLLTRALEKARQNPDTPTVIFAHTIKGWGLGPLQGRNDNHVLLLRVKDDSDLRRRLGIGGTGDFPVFAEGSPEAEKLTAIRRRLEEERRVYADGIRANEERDKQTLDELAFPDRIKIDLRGSFSTQAGYNAVLSRLRDAGRESEAFFRFLNSRIVGIVPDVGLTTLPALMTDRDIRLGIKEMFAVNLAGAFGKSEDFFGIKLFPIVVSYPMFLFRRALDPFNYSQYWGSRFTAVGTPASLNLEGSQHYALFDAAISRMMPGTGTWEPAHLDELEYIVPEQLRLAFEGGADVSRIHYLRLNVVPVRRAALWERLKRQVRYWGMDEDQIRTEWKEDVLKGGYRLVDHRGRPGYNPDENVVHIFASGAAVPEALNASDALLSEGVYANVHVVTNVDRLIGPVGEETRYAHLQTLVPLEERLFAPAVLVSDAHPLHLTGLGEVLGLGAGVQNSGPKKNSVTTHSREKLRRHFDASVASLAGQVMFLLHQRDTEGGFAARSQDFWQGTTDASNGTSVAPEGRPDRRLFIPPFLFVAGGSLTASAFNLVFVQNLFVFAAVLAAFLGFVYAWNQIDKKRKAGEEDVPAPVMLGLASVTTDGPPNQSERGRRLKRAIGAALLACLAYETNRYGAMNGLLIFMIGLGTIKLEQRIINGKKKNIKIGQDQARIIFQYILKGREKSVVNEKFSAFTERGIEVKELMLGTDPLPVGFREKLDEILSEEITAAVKRRLANLGPNAEKAVEFGKILDDINILRSNPAVRFRLKSVWEFFGIDEETVDASDIKAEKIGKTVRIFTEKMGQPLIERFWNPGRKKFVEESPGGLSSDLRIPLVSPSEGNSRAKAPRSEKKSNKNSKSRSPKARTISLVLPALKKLSAEHPHSMFSARDVDEFVNVNPTSLRTCLRYLFAENPGQISRYEESRETRYRWDENASRFDMSRHIPYLGRYDEPGFEADVRNAGVTDEEIIRLDRTAKPTIKALKKLLRVLAYLKRQATDHPGLDVTGPVPSIHSSMLVEYVRQLKVVFPETITINLGSSPDRKKSSFRWENKPTAPASLLYDYWSIFRPNIFADWSRLKTSGAVLGTVLTLESAPAMGLMFVPVYGMVLSAIWLSFLYGIHTAAYFRLRMVGRAPPVWIPFLLRPLIFAAYFLPVLNRFFFVPFSFPIGIGPVVHLIADGLFLLMIHEPARGDVSNSKNHPGAASLSEHPIEPDEIISLIHGAVSDVLNKFDSFHKEVLPPISTEASGGQIESVELARLRGRKNPDKRKIAQEYFTWLMPVYVSYLPVEKSKVIEVGGKLIDRFRRLFSDYLDVLDRVEKDFGRSEPVSAIRAARNYLSEAIHNIKAVLHQIAVFERRQANAVENDHRETVAFDPGGENPTSRFRPFLIAMAAVGHGMGFLAGGALLFLLMIYGKPSPSNQKRRKNATAAPDDEDGVLWYLKELSESFENQMFTSNDIKSFIPSLPANRIRVILNRLSDDYPLNITRLKIKGGYRYRWDNEERPFDVSNHTPHLLVLDPFISTDLEKGLVTDEEIRVLDRGFSKNYPYLILIMKVLSSFKQASAGSPRQEADVDAVRSIMGLRYSAAGMERHLKVLKNAFPDNIRIREVNDKSGKTKRLYKWTGSLAGGAGNVGALVAWAFGRGPSQVSDGRFYGLLAAESAFLAALIFGFHTYWFALLPVFISINLGLRAFLLDRNEVPVLVLYLGAVSDAVIVTGYYLFLQWMGPFLLYSNVLIPVGLHFGVDTAWRRLGSDRTDRTTHEKKSSGTVRKETDIRDFGRAYRHLRGMTAYFRARLKGGALVLPKRDLEEFLRHPAQYNRFFRPRTKKEAWTSLLALASYSPEEPGLVRALVERIPFDILDSDVRRAVGRSFSPNVRTFSDAFRASAGLPTSDQILMLTVFLLRNRAETDLSVGGLTNRQKALLRRASGIKVRLEPDSSPLTVGDVVLLSHQLHTLREVRKDMVRQPGWYHRLNGRATDEKEVSAVDVGRFGGWLSERIGAVDFSVKGAGRLFYYLDKIGEDIDNSLTDMAWDWTTNWQGWDSDFGYIYRELNRVFYDQTGLKKLLVSKAAHSRWGAAFINGRGSDGGDPLSDETVKGRAMDSSTKVGSPRRFADQSSVLWAGSTPPAGDSHPGVTLRSDEGASLFSFAVPVAAIHAPSESSPRTPRERVDELSRWLDGNRNALQNRERVLDFFTVYHMKLTLSLWDRLKDIDANNFSGDLLRMELADSPEDLFHLIGVMRDLESVLTAIDGEQNEFIKLNRYDSPDTGICEWVTGAARNALAILPLPGYKFMHHPIGKYIHHVFLKIIPPAEPDSTGGVPLAFDLAAGQLMDPFGSGMTVVEEADHYLNTVDDLLQQNIKSFPGRSESAESIYKAFRKVIAVLPSEGIDYRPNAKVKELKDRLNHMRRGKDDEDFIASMAGLREDVENVLSTLEKKSVRSRYHSRNNISPMLAFATGASGSALMPPALFILGIIGAIVALFRRAGADAVEEVWMVVKADDRPAVEEVMRSTLRRARFTLLVDPDESVAFSGLPAAVVEKKEFKRKERVNGRILLVHSQGAPYEPESLGLTLADLDHIQVKTLEELVGELRRNAPAFKIFPFGAILRAALRRAKQA